MGPEGNVSVVRPRFVGRTGPDASKNSDSAPQKGYFTILVQQALGNHSKTTKKQYCGSAKTTENKT